MNFLKSHLKRKVIQCQEMILKKLFKEWGPKRKWGEDVEDILYTFEARPYKFLTFEKTKGKITKIIRNK